VQHRPVLKELPPYNRVPYLANSNIEGALVIVETLAGCVAADVEYYVKRKEYFVCP